MATDHLKGGPYEVTLGASFFPPEPQKFYTIKYNFKPESLDTTKAGLLDEDSKGNVYLELPSKEAGDGAHKFEGTKQESKDVDCLLIFNEETQTFTLEHQHFVYTTKNSRRAKPLTSSANILALPPAASSSTVTTPQSDQVPTPANHPSFDEDDDPDEPPDNGDADFREIETLIDNFMDNGAFGEEAVGDDDEEPEFVAVPEPVLPAPVSTRPLALPPGGSTATSTSPTKPAVPPKRLLHTPKHQPVAVAPSSPNSFSSSAPGRHVKPAKSAHSSSGSSSSSSSSSGSSSSSSESGSDSGSESGSGSDSDDDLIETLEANIVQQLDGGGDAPPPPTTTTGGHRRRSSNNQPPPGPSAAGPATGVKPLSMRAYLEGGQAEEDEGITSSSSEDD